jgi:hypothetical protein
MARVDNPNGPAPMHRFPDKRERNIEHRDAFGFGSEEAAGEVAKAVYG